MRAPAHLAITFLLLAAAGCDRFPGWNVEREGPGPRRSLERADAVRRYQTGRVQVLVNPEATRGDVGASFSTALTGKFVVAVADCENDPDGAYCWLYAYDPALQLYLQAATFHEYRWYQATLAPYADEIDVATAHLFPAAQRVRTEGHGQPVDPQVTSSRRPTPTPTLPAVNGRGGAPGEALAGLREALGLNPGDFIVALFVATALAIAGLWAAGQCLVGLAAAVARFRIAAHFARTVATPRKERSTP